MKRKTKKLDKRTQLSGKTLPDTTLEVQPAKYGLIPDAVIMVYSPDSKKWTRFKDFRFTSYAEAYRGKYAINAAIIESGMATTHKFELANEEFFKQMGKPY